MKGLTVLTTPRRFFTDTLPSVVRISVPAVFFFVSADAAIGKPLRPDLTEAERVRVYRQTRPAISFDRAEPYEAMQGGAGTSLKLINRDAFSHPSGNLTFEKLGKFQIGNAFFRKMWVASPSSTLASDGLGPLFNARSCQSCHLKDGRGPAPEGPGFLTKSMVLFLSVPPDSEEEREKVESGAVLSVPEPVYGGQIQSFAVPPVKPEGLVRVAYERIPIVLNGGETVFLRRPRYFVENLSYGSLNKNVMKSPRNAPQMIGLGLLEAVHHADIVANSDPEDRDGDGISGRVNFVRDPQTGKTVVGRFGFKASSPSVLVQAAKAFVNDIGISNPLEDSDWGECTKKQTDCRSAPHGTQNKLGDTEAPDPVLEFVELYAKNLAVPARRDFNDKEVLRGKRLFYKSGCVSCHTPKYVTRKDASSEEHGFQLIWPYSDLLLHDMGEGLADNRPSGGASGSEWRTSPLWGIGLTKTVNPRAGYLHDGRASTLLEAILWHGGEAQAARDKVVSMPPERRRALVRFLESL